MAMTIVEAEPGITGGVDTTWTFTWLQHSTRWAD